MYVCTYVVCTYAHMYICTYVHMYGCTYVGQNGILLVPVAEMLELSKEGSMRFGCWLYSVAPGAEQVLDTQYEMYARTLLGADIWRKWATVQSEL